MKPLYEMELLGLSFAAIRRLPGLVLVLELGISAKPRENFARLRDIRVNDLPAHRPPALVLSRRTGQVSHPPCPTHFGREKGAAAEVRRRLGRHLRQVE